MTNKNVLIRAAAVGLMAVGIAIAGLGNTDILDPIHYYSFPIGSIAIDVQTLSQVAKDAGFAVIYFSGNTVTSFQGTEPATQPVDALLSQDRFLVIDGDRVYLRDTETRFAFSIRPAGNGHELVVQPLVEVAALDALTAIFGQIQALGIRGMDVDLVGGRSYVAGSAKGPAVPSGLALASDLYGLVVSENWFTYAASKGMTLLGLRIEVVVEKSPGASIPEPFSSFVGSETDQLASLLVPIDQLTPLGQLEAVAYVRLPYRPVAP